MLRISEICASGESVTLLLEGQVTQQSTEVVSETAEKVLEAQSHLILDLTGVTFADRRGIALLQDLQKRQVKLINGSPYLKEQLKDTRTV